MKDIKSIIEQIANEVDLAGGKMYYVGGYVRDLYCGKTPSDIDVRVIGINKKTFDEILKKFGKTYWINARYDLVKLIGLDIDFSSPENKDGTLKTIEDLIVGVDFTMNSIFVDVVTGEIVDPYNGREDIENGIIRISDFENTDNHFMAVRAARFKAKLGFQIESRSMLCMQEFSYANVNRQRILSEFRKIISDPEVSQSEFFKEAFELGILDKLFSPLGELKNLEVDVNGIRINVFEHTIRILDYLMRYKDRICDFEELYMVALTYHFRSIDLGTFSDDKFREFFGNIMATNKMKHAVVFFQDTEQKLFDVYNNFQNMSEEELLTVYQRYRKRLEDAGYFVECFNIGLHEKVSEDEMMKSKERLDLWKEKIQELREKSIKTVNIAGARRKKNYTSSRERYESKPYTMANIGEITEWITPEQLLYSLENVGKGRGGIRDGRNR